MGYARKLEEVGATENLRECYLPHFALWNINKPGKIRLVYDAVAKYSGHSLNDVLLQVSDFIPSSTFILLRFLQRRYAITGDNQEIFHQVIIRQEERCNQRFLRRDGDESRNPDIYEINVMIFGAVSSPSTAQFVKKKNAIVFISYRLC